MRMNRAWAAVLVLGAAAGIAAAADMGGGFWAICGDCRTVLKSHEDGPAEHFANWRLTFDGNAGDREGTGTLRAYDDKGQYLRGQAPFTWTSKRGRAFQVDLLGPEYAGMIEDLVLDGMEEGTPVVDLARAKGKGVLRRDGMKLTVQVRGTVSYDGGEPRELKMKIRLE